MSRPTAVDFSSVLPEPTSVRADSGRVWRGRLSLAMLALAVTLLAATFFLMSPRTDAVYPGAIPWSGGSWLSPLVDVMSLGYRWQSERGVEIKQFALHLAALLALLLLAARSAVSALRPTDADSAAGSWLWAQVLLGVWVAISASSALWSRTPDISLAQAALYAFPLVWAVALAWTLESRDAPRLLWAYVVIAALGGALCVWYYHERNPFHRPGFPIGNPGPLAAVMLPAMFICAAVTGGWLWDRRRGRADAGDGLTVLLAGIALIPLAWCFELAHSRAALVGAVSGIAGVLFITTTRRTRLWVVVGSLVAAAIGIHLLSSSMQDLTMARGATLRFRAYAWNYAAELWGRRPITGMGAGAYPRLANDLTTQDRALDPGAFMGDVVEHAHNEMFEIFAEIGLIGGLSFVAGHLASIVAASALLQANLSRRRRWLLVGLTAGLIGLLADSCFGVGPRLPGVPAVWFTLLGVLWALSRATSPRRTSSDFLEDVGRRRARLVAAVVMILAALGGFRLAQRDWSGVRFELQARRALEQADFARAIIASEKAAAHLLDPVRRLVALAREVEARVARVRITDGANLPTDLALAAEAWRAAIELDRLAPNFYRAPALAAEAAERAAELLSDADPVAAQSWRGMALQAWLRQRMQRLYDRPALLALAGSPISLGDRLGLLRDALREGLPDAEWMARFRAVLSEPDAEEMIDVLVSAVAAYTSDSELNALILSGAPEAHRLRGLARGLRADFSGAAEAARQAVALYEPMRARFPGIQSVALAELAEYEFMGDPGGARAAEALERALDELPRIQEQQFAALAAPYRLSLVRMLLATGDERRAGQVLEEIHPNDPGLRRGIMLEIYLGLVQTFAPVEGQGRLVLGWLAAAERIDPLSPGVWYWRLLAAAGVGREHFEAELASARAAGLPDEVLAELRERVCAQRPVCEEAGFAPARE